MCRSYSDFNFGVTFLEHNVFIGGLDKILKLYNFDTSTGKS